MRRSKLEAELIRLGVDRDTQRTVLAAHDQATKPASRGRSFGHGAPEMDLSPTPSI